MEWKLPDLSEASFRDYVTFTATTAVYPGAGLGSVRAKRYARFGLINEVGEVLGKVKKLMRGDTKFDLEAASGLVVPELGDVMWYVARMITEHGIDPGDVMSYLGEYEERVKGSDYNEATPSSHPNKDLVALPLPEAIVSLDDLAQAVTEIYNCCTAVTYNLDRFADQDDLAIALGITTFAVCWIAEHLDPYSASAMLDLNVTKLKSRKRRGVIKGDGDKR